MGARLKAWTVMCYLVAEPENRLNDLAAAELDAILNAAVRYTNDLHVIVQIDFNGRRGMSRIVVDSPKIQKLKPHPIDEKTLPGNVNTLRSFFSETSTTYPGTRQAVFFWGHSFGPGGMFLRPDGLIASPHSVEAAGSSLDADASTDLSVPDLASALSLATGRTPKHLDLLVFKDCFMNTLEVAYELSSV